MSNRLSTFTRSGLEFDVLDEGPMDGEVVVLLHGFPQLNTSWAKVTPLLNDAGYRTIAPNQRGFARGARPRGRRAYRVTELVDDLVALVDLIGRPVHLVGHDWGAAVSWTAVSHRPDLFRSHVALSVPHPGAFLEAMPRGQMFRSWYMALFNIPGIPERMIAGRHADRVITGYFGMPDDAFASFRNDFDVERLRGGIAWYRAAALDVRSFLRHATVPSTYLSGTRDTPISAVSKQLCEKYVDADYRFEVLDGVSHWTPEEAPEAVAEAIIERARG